jgi:hypothetical protein
MVSQYGLVPRDRQGKEGGHESTETSIRGRMMKLEVSIPDVRRRRFTGAFKYEAVRLTRESGRPVAQVARKLRFLTMCWIVGGANSSRSNPRAARARRCGSSRMS